MMRYEPKRMLLRNFESSYGRFLTTAHLAIKSNYRKKQLVPELKVYYQLIKMVCSKNMNNRLNTLQTHCVGMI